MIKLFRKNRQNSLMEGKIVNYFRYAIGEIFLVVMGILIALYINNNNSERLVKISEISSYKNIKRQINDDKIAINSSNEQNKKLYKKYITAIYIIEQNNRKKIDILGKIALDLTDYSDIDRSSTIYQNLINSGESKILKNREILDHIQKLEEAYIFVNRIEQIHFKIINNIGQDLYKNIKFYDQSVREPEKVFGIDFQNHFIAAYSICIKKEYAYGIALKQIEIITKLIDEEIK